MKENKKVFIYGQFEGLKTFSSLCEDTLRKNLPEGYEIIKLSLLNLSNYVPEASLPDPIWEKYSSSRRFDVIRASVLKHNGGIFISDGVFASNSLSNQFSRIENILKSFDTVAFKLHGEIFDGFLAANKGSDMSSKNAAFLDCEEEDSVMEFAMYGDFSEYLFQNYYFADKAGLEDFFKISKGLVFLNPKWIKEEYQNVSREEFLKQDILLAKIFKKIITPQED